MDSEEERDEQAVRIMREAIRNIESGKSVALFLVVIGEKNWSRLVLAPNKHFQACRALAIETAEGSQILTGAVNAEIRRRGEVQQYN